MYLIIDGYNVIGTHHRDMHDERTQLIRELVAYQKKTGHDITLVFDGWKDGQGRETKTVTGGITVIYSGLGERADAVIQRIIVTQRRKWVVVSSDREIEKAAWRASCVPIRSEQFMSALEAHSRGHDSDLAEDDPLIKDEEEYDMPRKGSPRKRSRKEKEIQRVLEKL